MQNRESFMVEDQSSTGEPTNTQNFRFVLIDDDEVCRKVYKGFADAEGTLLDCFNSLEEMGSIGHLAAYDVAIVDYDLGHMNGLEIAEYLPSLFGGMPMVLISGKNRDDKVGKWPSSVRCFVSKDAGPEAILAAAKAQAKMHKGGNDRKLECDGGLRSPRNMGA